MAGQDWSPGGRMDVVGHKLDTKVRPGGSSFPAAWWLLGISPAHGAG